MSTYIIQGGKKLQGEVTISGQKCSTTNNSSKHSKCRKTTLYNLPDIHDTQMMFEILKSIGRKSNKKGKQSNHRHIKNKQI